MSERLSFTPGRRGGPGQPPAKEPTIIVPLDGTTHSLDALPVAKALANLHNATLHIVHVSERVLPPEQVTLELGLTPEQLHGSVVDQATGAPAAAITHLATEMGSLFIVMCTHTGMPKPLGRLGRVAEGVMHAAPCPVVLARPERGTRPWLPRRILLAHDGTPTGAAGVGPAADLAHRAGAELVVLHVAGHGMRPPPEPGTLTGPRYLDQPQHEWPSWEKEFVGRLRALGHPPAALKLRLTLGKGEPGPAIVQAAAERGLDLVVLAWRGSLEAERATVLKAVLHEASCPVLVVRTEGQ